MRMLGRRKSVAALAGVLLLGGISPARAELVVDTAHPDWTLDSSNSVVCTAGARCVLNLASWTTAWGCYSETFAGVVFAYTNCKVHVDGSILAQRIPNAPCALTMINSLRISFVSGIHSDVGGTWEQSATFVPVDNSAVGTTRYRVTMHGSGPYTSHTVGAGSAEGEFDLRFPAPGLLRSTCKSAATGKLYPVLAGADDRTDGTVIQLMADSVQ